VEKGLRSIQPFGLTPLADGLYSALRYVRQSHVARNTLLLLITDGIPTVPRESVNPLDDALEAADRLRAAKLATACVGLQPNQKYLCELMERANGSLYVVDELSRDTLVSIAYEERQKQKES
jgi:magnesium chelatase subunit D